jgi:hypothetical protein
MGSNTSTDNVHARKITAEQWLMIDEIKKKVNFEGKPECTVLPNGEQLPWLYCKLGNQADVIAVDGDIKGSMLNSVVVCNGMRKNLIYDRILAVRLHSSLDNNNRRRLKSCGITVTRLDAEFEKLVIDGRNTTDN